MSNFKKSFDESNQINSLWNFKNYSLQQNQLPLHNYNRTVLSDSFENKNRFEMNRMTDNFQRSNVYSYNHPQQLLLSLNSFNKRLVHNQMPNSPQSIFHQSPTMSISSSSSFQYGGSSSSSFQHGGSSSALSITNFKQIMCNNSCKHIDRTKLFIGNLPASTRLQELLDLFKKYGKINEKLSVVKDQNYAFIHFYNEDDATKALSEMNDSLFKDRYIRVQYSTSQGHVKRSKSNHFIEFFRN